MSRLSDSEYLVFMILTRINGTNKILTQIRNYEKKQKYFNMLDHKIGTVII